LNQKRKNHTLGAGSWGWSNRKKWKWILLFKCARKMRCKTSWLLRQPWINPWDNDLNLPTPWRLPKSKVTAGAMCWCLAWAVPLPRAYVWWTVLRNTL
jgi:hypothetical protein